MIRHSTKIVAEIIIGALVMVFFLGLALVWRLSEGPITLSFITPYLEDSLSDPGRGIDAKISDMSLAWDEDLRRPEFRAFGISLRDSEGVAILELPRADVRISLPLLLEGRIAVEQVDVIGISLSLARTAEGRVRLTSAGVKGDDPALPQTDSGGLNELTLDDWLAEGTSSDDQEPSEPSIFSALRRVRIIGASLVMSDENSGLTWRAPQAYIDMRRNDTGIVAALRLSLEVGQDLAELTADANYEQETGRIDATTRFSGIHPGRLAALLPFRELKELQGLDLELRGTMVVSLNAAGTITQAGLEIDGGPGFITVPGVDMTVFPVRGVRLEAGVDLLRAAVNLRRFDISLGQGDSGPELALSGELQGLSGDLFGRQARDLRTRLKFTLAGMDVEALPLYWPEGVSQNGRDWVLENITAGDVDNLVGEVALFAPLGNWDELVLENLDGTFTFAGVDAHYLRPMPPVVGVDGTAAFSPQGLVLEMQGGTSGDIVLGSGTLDITGLNAKEQFLAVEFTAIGPLPSVFSLLNHPRVALIDKLGLNTEGAVGSVSARARFAFPLLADLTFDEMDVSAQGDLTDTGLIKVLLGQDVTGANVKLDLSKDSMSIAGEASLADVPLTFKWRENFTPIKGIRRRLEGTVATVGHEKLQIFGIASAPYLTGPLSADFLYTEQAKGEAQVDVKASLTSATMEIRDLGNWRKAAGEEGQASFSLSLLKGTPRSLQNIQVTAGTLKLSGDAQFNAEGRDIAQARLSALAFGEQALRDVEITRGPKRLTVSVAGGSLDARPFLKSDEDEDTAATEPDDTHLTLTLRNIERLRFGDESYLENGHLELERVKEGWRRFLLRGRIPKQLRSSVVDGQERSPEVEVSYAPATDGRQVLEMAAADAGGLFRSLDFFDTMDGGVLRINGSREGIARTNPLRGNIEIKDFKLIDAPVLAKLLTVASLTGIVNVLSGEGIEFKRAKGDFEAIEGRISSDLLRIYGSALGLTAQGSVDIDQNLADLRGTVVPAYAVNQVLGAIPLLGDILTGGEGEGVFAVTYTMTGPLDDPVVAVNPLAALAPGFLRGLFDVGNGNSDTDRPRAIPEEVDR